MMTALSTLAIISSFFAGWLGMWSIIAIPLSLKLKWRPFRPTPAGQKLALLLPLYLLAPAAIGIANRQLGQTWANQGWTGTAANLIDIGWGWGIAIAGLSLVFTLKRWLGLVTVTAPATPLAAGSRIKSWSQRLVATLGLAVLGLLIGGAEESVFRGWLQTQLEMSASPWLAAIAASLLFALAHLIWDGQAGLWQQPGLWLLGMVLVWARWMNGGAIALAWGLHAGWITGLAYIGEFVRPLPATDKPMWLTGRPQQPLTDLLDLILLLLTALLMIPFASWRA
ncbi:MAG: CPBP family intramembrane glutamic endopeptidase [Cyanobacteria bacterium P01_C01_bin.120]